jgi:hypothetical protein
MAVYVDDLVWYPGKGRWCHMVSNNLEELHAMAEKIGLRREWFQNHAHHPHYDLMALSRALAVENGAIEITRHELVRIFKQQQE